MSHATQLSETERQRMLQVMGFEVWVRRGSEPLRAATPAAVIPRALPVHAADAAVRTPQARARPEPAAHAERAQPAVQSVRSRGAPVSARSVPRNQPSVLLGTHSVLLVLEQRVHADAPLIQQLMRTLPGCVVCTPDTVSHGTAKFALQLGVDATLPADVLGVRVPELAVLQKSASARRALWWSIKPMLRAAKGQ